MIRKTTILLFIISILNITNINAQGFLKSIEANFKGKLKFCLALNDSYYYIGHFDSTGTKHFKIYKTDTSGNVLLKNTRYHILHNEYNYTQNDDYILIADSNKLMKFDADLNLLWTKYIQSNSYIKKVKYSRDNFYLIDINNQIIILDTAGNIARTSNNYSDNLCDFDLINDTLFTLTSRYNSTTNNNETIVTKYAKNNIKVFEKTLSQLNNSYPKYLVIRPNNNQIISSDGKYFGYTLLSSILNDSFFVINSVWKNLHNFELSNIKYNNNSLLAYWYNDKFSINRIYQYNDTLDLQAGYTSSSYDFTDFYTTKQGTILIIEESGIIMKSNGKNLTGLNNDYLRDDVKFSPNPFTESTSIKLNKYEACKLYVYDLSGKLIFKNTFEPTNEITIESKDLPSRGMYLFKLELPGKVCTGKVVY